MDDTFASSLIQFRNERPPFGLRALFLTGRSELFNLFKSSFELGGNG